MRRVRGPLRHSAPLLLCAWAAAWPPAAASAATPDYRDFNELDLESLLDQTVITASKYEQKISDLPVATTVITADEIARSGASSIPELLMKVPGLDVMVNTASSFDVSARGLNEPASNALLVLVDGRSVYADFYGLTPWEHLEVSLDEIHSIEIIKGPGSALYGANAFAGVINIRTWDPAALAGTTLRLSGSDQGSGLGSALHAGQAGRVAWKAGGAWEENRDWEHDASEQDISRLNGLVRWENAAGTRVSVSGGHSNGSSRLVPSAVDLALDGRMNYLRSDLNRGRLAVRWFWTHWLLDIIPRDFDAITELSALDAGLHDLEVQHTFEPAPGNRLLWGTSYRHKRVDWTLQRQEYSQDIWAAFLYDEWRLSPQWLLSLGVRWDNHPLVGDHVAPRGGLVYKPAPNQALRASYGVAYRDPTYLETYWYSEIAGLPGMNLIARGSQQLQSEEIRSLETGYQGLVADDVLVSLSAFQNRVRQLIDLRVASTFPSPPAPYPGIPSEIVFRNAEAWDITGGELSVDIRLADTFTCRSGYSYVWSEDAVSGRGLEQAPRHQWTTSWTATPVAGHALVFDTRYRSRTHWDYSDLIGSEGAGEGDERFTVDLRWHGQLPGGAAAATCGVLDLFDDVYRDHPLTIEQRRRFFATLTLRF